MLQQKSLRGPARKQEGRNGPFYCLSHLVRLIWFVPCSGYRLDRHMHNACGKGLLCILERDHRGKARRSEAYPDDDGDSAGNQGQPQHKSMSALRYLTRYSTASTASNLTPIWHLHSGCNFLRTRCPNVLLVVVFVVDHVF